MSGGDREIGALQRRIDELAEEVAASHEHAEQLEQALESSRTIGAAIGIVMASRGVDREVAFVILSRISQETNRKLRDVAAELLKSVETGTA